MVSNAILYAPVNPLIEKIRLFTNSCLRCGLILLCCQVSFVLCKIHTAPGTCSSPGRRTILEDIKNAGYAAFSIGVSGILKPFIYGHTQPGYFLSLSVAVLINL